LNLPSKFNEVELKHAYRDISQVWHPDKHGQNERLREKAEKVFKEINGAYQYFKNEMSSGQYEFNETNTHNQPPEFESDVNMAEIFRVVEEEVKKQYEERIHEAERRYKNEVSTLRQKHNEYISRISQAQNEAKQKYEERVSDLSSSLDGVKAELSKEKTKSEHFQKLFHRSFWSLSAAHTLFQHGIAYPVTASARIFSDFTRLSCALLVRLCKEHVPDRMERVLFLTTFGVISVVAFLILALITPVRVLIVTACLFAIVASTLYIAQSKSPAKEDIKENDWEPEP